MAEINQINGTKLFLDSIQAQKSDIGIVTLYAVVIGLLYLIVPLAVQELVSIVAFGVLLQPLIILSILVMTALFLVGLFQVVQRYIVELIQQRLFVHNAFDMVTRIKLAPMGALGNKQINLFFEVMTLQKSYAKLLVNGLGAALQAIVGLIILAFYHPFFILLTTFLVIGTLSALMLGGIGGLRTSLVESTHKYELIHWLQELGYCNEYFKLTKGNNLVFQKTDSINLEYIKARNKHFKILIRQFICSFIVQVIANGSLLALGGWLVIQGQLTLGQLIAAELVVASIIGGIDKVVGQADVFYDLLTSLAKLEFLKNFSKRVEEGNKDLPYKKAGIEIECRNLTFRYNDEKPSSGEIIKGLNFSTVPGERVIISGGQGSGKRTLLNLLAGLYPSTKGTIYLDNIEIKDIKFASLGQSVSIIKSDTNAIFEGTIAENVLLGREEVIPLRKIIDLVGLTEDVDSMTGGLKSQLASQGANISTSQISRILIARGLVSAPRLLLISHEVLSNLSEPTQEHIFDSLATLFGFAPTIIFFANNGHLDSLGKKKYILETGSLKEISNGSSNEIQAP
ncbi:MAG: ATP-binding cassette domain-containing protein [Candidatus Caenarcaniphilales bacterium]|nr:ATP-binding cassette domain-containing protein [Candidatus Caenarcaniphilales bacterium]